MSEQGDRKAASPLRLVAEFYQRVNRTVRNKPTVDLPDDEVQQIIDLLDEEVSELRQALEDRNLVRIADGLGDVVYVIYGAALQFGIPLDEIVQEIHDANMTKPNSDGSIRRSSAGKILRGDAYVPPDLKDKLRMGLGIKFVRDSSMAGELFVMQPISPACPEINRRPELGQISAHLAAAGAIEGIAEDFIQHVQIPDLHRSAGRCRPDGAYPPGYRPVYGRRFSAQIRSLPTVNSQVGALRNRSRPKRGPSQGRSSAGKILRGDAYVPPDLKDKLRMGLGIKFVRDSSMAGELFVMQPISPACPEINRRRAF